MRKSNFALRVPPNLLDDARSAAESEGIALNQLITLALAEKISAIRTKEFFEERSRRADPAKVDEILARAGKDNPPVPGDEIPRDLVGFVEKRRRQRAKALSENRLKTLSVAKAKQSPARIQRDNEATAGGLSPKLIGLAAGAKRKRRMR